MTHPIAFRRAHWIIVTPSPASGAWRNAIETACAATGRRLAVASPEHTPDLEDPMLIIFTDDAALAPRAGSAITALVPDPAYAVTAWATTTGQPLGESIWQASRRIVDALNLPSTAKVLDAEDIRTAGQSLQLFDDFEIVSPAAATLPLTGDVEQGVSEVLSQLRRVAGDASSPEMHWPPALFNYESRGRIGMTKLGDMDTTGRPRFLVTGPYFAMTAGLWRADIRFSVDDTAYLRTYRIDWGGVEDFTSHTFNSPHSGVYELSLEYAFTETAPAEIRFILLEGSFSGEASFAGAKLTKLPPQ